jgi:hypothetical protein
MSIELIVRAVDLMCCHDWDHAANLLREGVLDVESVMELHMTDQFSYDARCNDASVNVAMNVPDTDTSCVGCAPPMLLVVPISLPSFESFDANAFAFYPFAFVPSEMTNKATINSNPINKDQRLRPSLEYSAVLIYNTALAYHCKAIHSGSLLAFKKSLRLYQVAAKVLHSFTRTENIAPACIKLLQLATYNNMGNILVKLHIMNGVNGCDAAIRRLLQSGSEFHSPPCPSTGLLFAVDSGILSTSYQNLAAPIAHTYEGHCHFFALSSVLWTVGRFFPNSAAAA